MEYKTEKFIELIKEWYNGKEYYGDREVMSLLYIIAEGRGLYESRYQLVDFKKHEIKPKNVNGCWSSSERALIRLAYNLFNGFNYIYENEELVESTDYTPTNLFWNLDSHNTDVAITSLKIRFKN